MWENVWADFIKCTIELQIYDFYKGVQDELNNS